MTVREEYPLQGREAYQAIGPDGSVVAQANTRKRATERAQIKGVQSPFVIRVRLDEEGRVIEGTGHR